MFDHKRRWNADLDVGGVPKGEEKGGHQGPVNPASAAMQGLKDGPSGPPSPATSRSGCPSIDGEGSDC